MMMMMMMGWINVLTAAPEWKLLTWTADGDDDDDDDDDGNVLTAAPQ